MNTNHHTNATLNHCKAMNAIQTLRADKFALSLESLIDELTESGLTHHQMSEELNKRGLRTPRGHFWMHKSVRNVCTRLYALKKAAAAKATLEARCAAHLAQNENFFNHFHVAMPN